MFCIDPDPTFTAPVAITLPGGQRTGTISLTFRPLGRRELAGWLADAIDPTADARVRSDAEYLARVVVGWADVRDAEGREVPFGVAMLEDLLNRYPTAGGEIHRAYLAALTEAAAKNSAARQSPA
jgi:hypothetical protein